MALRVLKSERPEPRRASTPPVCDRWWSRAFDIVMSFNEQVWELCKKVPKGKVTTYKELANALNTKAYRAVGNAMNQNPYGAWSAEGKDVVPCHRVINSDGRIGGFARGVDAKIALLRKEGVVVEDGRVDLGSYLFTF